jgi:hypothetical protein
LFNILEREGTTDQLSSSLRPMIKRKNEAGGDIKKALGELEAIIDHSRQLGLRSKIVVSPSLVYHPEHFSGMICQVVLKKKRGHDILAAGGRFDRLIASYSSKLNIDNESGLKSASACGVGISICLDILAAGIQDDDLGSHFSTLDVLIHSSTTSPAVLKHKLELAQQLWSQGIRCTICDPQWSVDDVQELGVEAGAAFIVIFQDGGLGEAATARLRTLNSEPRFTERKMAIPDICDTLVKQVKLLASEAVSEACPSTLTSSGGLQRMDSSAKMPMSTSEAGPRVQFDYQYFPDKKNAAVKKRIEASINSKMASILTSLTSQTFVQIFVLPFNGNVIRSMVALMDFNEDESKFQDGLKELISRHPRHKKELTSICQDINDLKCGGRGMPSGVFVFYSSEDHIFRVLMM